MLDSQLFLLTRIQVITRIVLIGGLGIALIAQRMLPHSTNIQMPLAIAALIVGIPHGAVDHLVAVPKLMSLKMAVFIATYLFVAGLALWFILAYPVLGFQLIVLMSAAHFGVGDASFYAELFQRSTNAKFPKLWFAIAAGLTPVVLPLVSRHTTSALNMVNPVLIDWAGSHSRSLFIGVIVLDILVLVMLAMHKCFAPMIDLGILMTLALTISPLVAFALYFGLWHAIRHTVRLTLDYGPSVAQHELARPWQSFWLSVRAGLPAVALVSIFTVSILVANHGSLSKNLLWYLLVVIWALTVPHMALTARADTRALKA